MTEQFWTRIIEAFKSADSPIESQLVAKKAFGALCYMEAKDMFRFAREKISEKVGEITDLPSFLPPRRNMN